MKKVFSKWWVLAIAFVLIYGFAVLITITCKAFRDRPPIPERVVDAKGQLLFTRADVEEGQSLFLRYGLMDNGSVWGHGAYLGPDFSAAYLHDLALNYEAAYPRPDERSKVSKENRYDSDADVLVYNDVEAKTLSEAPARWKEYFREPKNNGGLPANLITDPTELRKLSAYFSWAAWATIATRPGSTESYTNNFPYEPSLSNTPGTDTFVWSAASILFLLIGIGACLCFVGRNPQDRWNPDPSPIQMAMPDGNAAPSVGALLKFCAVVGLLFLGQTLIGGCVAHYRADPSSFYGWDMSGLWPSSLMRTWHLQLAIFWIATGFVIGGLVLSRSLGGRDWKGLKPLINLLFVAFAVVIFGSCLAEWAGISGWWDDATFWLGSQGWEYIELGRAWQYALIVGLLVWAVVLIRNTWPALRRVAPPSAVNPQESLRLRAKRPLAIVFLIAAIAIPVFYLPAIFFGSGTNFTVVDTWRFWVIHLWVEGFFETFATVMVALVFIQLGIVSRMHGLRIIFLDIILTLMGGVIGTGHHWYFEGQTYFNMAVSSCFSALEVVPLVILTVEAAGFLRTSRMGGLPGVARQHRWTLNYFMAVGVWNFLGAGVFGFLINTPIVSYYEIGTMLTPNHGHAAMFGVFGFLALGLTVFAMRKNFTDEQWVPIAKWLKVAFWGLNVGLALMLFMSLLPGGFVQLFDAFKNGYWHARSIEFTNNATMSTIGWLRIAGDLIFIFAGALPFFVACALAWWKGFRNSRLAAANAKAEADIAEELENAVEPK